MSYLRYLCLLTCSGVQRNSNKTVLEKFH